MLERIDPRVMILIGFGMVLFGVIVPLLMIFQVIQTTYWLSFLSFGASVGGVFLGMIGAAYYARDIRKKRQ